MWWCEVYDWGFFRVILLHVQALWDFLFTGWCKCTFTSKCVTQTMQRKKGANCPIMWFWRSLKWSFLPPSVFSLFPWDEVRSCGLPTAWSSTQVQGQIWCVVWARVTNDTMLADLWQILEEEWDATPQPHVTTLLIHLISSNLAAVALCGSVWPKKKVPILRGG